MEKKEPKKIGITARTPSPKYAIKIGSIKLKSSKQTGDKSKRHVS